MKKLSPIFLSFLILALASYPSLAMMKAEDGEEGKVMIQPAGQMQEMNTNEVEVRNQGEETEIKTMNQEEEHQEMMGEDSESSESAEVGSNGRNINAREHMSTVATEVEKLLAIPDRQGGIGEQVRVIAQEQQQTQEQLQTHLGELESRTGLVRALIGPNFKAINGVQGEIQANQERIDQLVELQAGALYPAEKEEVSQAIAALELQNKLLQEKLQQELNTRSAFGWLFRFFN